MMFYIPYSFEMYGKVPVEADSFEEAKEKAHEWLKNCSYQELDEHVNYLINSPKIDELGEANDEEGNTFDM